MENFDSRKMFHLTALDPDGKQIFDKNEKLR